jgi:hypothetical protein
MLCPSERHCNSNSKNQNKLGKPLATLFGQEKNLVTRQKSGVENKKQDALVARLKKIFFAKPTSPPCAATTRLPLRVALRSAKFAFAL